MIIFAHEVSLNEDKVWRYAFERIRLKLRRGQLRLQDVISLPRASISWLTLHRALEHAFFFLPGLLRRHETVASFVGRNFPEARVPIRIVLTFDVCVTWFS